MVDKKELKTLSNRIKVFLDTYANIRPDYDEDYDDEDEKYTSPDASMLKHCADVLSLGQIPTECWSEWSSGGYRPYTSKEGKLEHDSIVSEIYKLIKNK